MALLTDSGRSAALAALADADVARMERLAWRDAARCWQEYRHGPMCADVRRILADSAREAEAFWQHLHAERIRRGMGAEAAYTPAGALTEQARAAVDLAPGGEADAYAHGQ